VGIHQIVILLPAAADFLADALLADIARGILRLQLAQHIGIDLIELLFLQLRH